MSKRYQIDTLYIVEAKGELDTLWGYYCETFRTQRLARENIRARGLLRWPCERYRIVRYRRAGVVR